MSVIRVQRKDRDFFTIKREALNNSNLSFKAKGLWAYAMSRKDEWNFHVSQLIKVSKEKKTAIYAAIKELIKEGYCSIDQKHKENGRWESVDYVLFETLEDAEEFKKSLPHSGFPQAGFPQAGNQPLVKNESSEDRLVEEIPIPTSVGSAESSLPKNRREFGTNPRAQGTNPRAQKTNPGRKKDKKEVARFVMITQIQEEELLKKAEGSKELLQKWFDFLSNWKIGKGIENRPNDFLAICRWVIKAVEQEASKPKLIDRTESHKSLAEKIARKFRDRQDIIVGYNYIEFNMGPLSPHIKFGDYGFEEQVYNNLRKMGLRLEPPVEEALVV